MNQITFAQQEFIDCLAVQMALDGSNSETDSRARLNILARHAVQLCEHGLCDVMAVDHPDSSPPMVSLWLPKPVFYLFYRDSARYQTTIELYQARFSDSDLLRIQEMYARKHDAQ